MALRRVRKRPFLLFTVKETIKKFTLGRVKMQRGSTVGPKWMTGWRAWSKKQNCLFAKVLTYIMSTTMVMSKNTKENS